MLSSRAVAKVPSDWPVVTVAEVCDQIIDCVNKTAPTVTGPTPFRMIRTTNVRGGWVDTQNVKYVDEEVFRIWTRRGEPRAGDVILTREAPLGEVGMLRSSEPVFLGQRLVMYRADPSQLDNRFLLYSMLDAFVQSQISALGSGATVEHMRVPDCERLRLRLPPLSTQQTIASVLSAYDGLIENNQQRIGLLEEMAQAIYREWFVSFRFPGHEKSSLVESALGYIPEDWRIVTLDDVCQRITDGAHSSPPSRSRGLPMASVKDMTSRRLDLSKCRLISETDFRDLVTQDCRPRIGDVLVAKDGSYLKHVFEVIEDQEVVILSSIALLRPNELLRPRILAFHLRQPEIKARLTGYVSGVAIPRIVLKDFKVFSLALPPRDLQEQFEGLVEPLVKEALLLEQENINLRITRDLLLPRLISGELAVSHLDLELGDTVT
jgi:type I restriction enzyme S subunit